MPGYPRLSALMLTSLLLAACGSDDSSPDTAAGSPAPAPAPGPAPSPAPIPNPAPAPAADDQATYRITFTGQWSSANGFGSVPGSAHFSPVIGSAVNDQSTLWQSGELSSPGIERVAEDGTTAAFSAEIEAEVAAGTAAGVSTASGTVAETSTSMDIVFTRAFSLLTIASMVAPSSDWFVGVNRFSLLDGNGDWMNQAEIQLRVYDAGTEDGSNFSAANAATDPLAPISRLNGLADGGQLNFVDGFVNGNAIARIEIERIE